MAASARTATGRPLPHEDLAHVMARAGAIWPSLDGARIFVTGGTGFFGRWLVESALFAATKRGSRLEMLLLTRDARRFAAQAPHLAADPRLRLYEGDVRSFAFPEGAFTHVIHAATDVDLRAPSRSPSLTLSTIVEGTRRVLELAADRHVRAVLFTSSGAVYGRQPAGITHIGEDFEGSRDPTDAPSVYGEAKRGAEQVCAAYAGSAGLAVKIARCFTFVGPRMPLDAGFAVGDFVRDALHGGPIEVRGAGASYRSYLYAADLAVWLWTILVRGAPMRPYNVGSEQALTIADLARIVAETAGTGIRIAQPPASDGSVDRYVPSTARAREELGLAATVGIEEAVARTLRWYGPTP